MGRCKIGLAFVLAAAVVVGLADAAWAQQPAQRPPARQAASKAQPKPGDTGGDAQLRTRVEQLEEQLADMQVMIGTLESLGRAGAASPGPAGRPAAGVGGGVEQARIDSLETQIRALTAQLEQLSGQVRQLSGNRRSEAAPAMSPEPGAHVGGAAVPVPPAAPAGFGSAPAPTSERDPIGRMLGQPAPQATSAPVGLPPSAAAAGNPRELYETAYGYLLQQDYGAAEVAFEEFMRRYPTDRLAPDAQYWLGETLYVQRRYKPAGQAFLVVVEKYKGSAKVPNSLLKLAQSLEQLGQKDCGIFAELDSRHPEAPADVKARARIMKQRQGC